MAEFVDIIFDDPKDGVRAHLMRMIAFYEEISLFYEELRAHPDLGDHAEGMLEDIFKKYPAVNLPVSAEMYTIREEDVNRIKMCILELRKYRFDA